jgi:hypothetical protein
MHEGYPFDWLVPTLIFVASILVFNEVYVAWLMRKREKRHLYEKLQETVNRMADDSQKTYNDLKTIERHTEEQRKTTPHDEPNKD